MPRGKAAADGATRVAQNGYHYTKVDGRGWVLTHWLVMEKHLGRKIRADESVRFQSKDKTNFNLSNLKVIKKKTASLRSQKARLEARIEELQAELDDVNARLESS